MSEEFKIIDKSYYKLYGNLLGKYPVQTKVIGDFNKDNLKIENKNGIMNLSINSHGQWDNIDQSVFSDNNLYIREARDKGVNERGKLNLGSL